MSVRLCVRHQTFKLTINHHQLSSIVIVAHQSLISHSLVTHQLLISRSSVAHQLLISCSSVAHQSLISRSSVAHQSLISRSSVTHQSLISRSSVAHQSLISRSSVTHQSLISCSSVAQIATFKRFSLVNFVFIYRLVCQPLDVAKIRLQLQVELGQARKYKNLIELMLKLPREEGMAALWKGWRQNH